MDELLRALRAYDAIRARWRDLRVAAALALKDQKQTPSPANAKKALALKVLADTLRNEHRAAKAKVQAAWDKFLPDLNIMDGEHQALLKEFDKVLKG